MAECDKSGLQFKEEVRISVPWGHLAAKIWGPSDGDPVLALHGWQDNAGTFDSLAPLLSNIRLVCLEFCGHGASSHNPPGMFLSYFNHVYHVKLAVDYFKWEKFSLMGHSMGGQVALIFASMYPDKVMKLVSLDALKMLSSIPESLPSRMRGVLDDYEKIALKSGRSLQTFSYDQAREKIIKNYKGSLEGKHDADILLKRSLKEIGDDKFVFTRDLKTVVPPSLFNDLTTEQLKSIARGITCPFLLIKARDSISSVTSEPKELHEEFIQLYANSSKDFRYVEVDGKHHVHLTRPSMVASYIGDFLCSG